jgi:hypothetical protein
MMKIKSPTERLDRLIWGLIAAVGTIVFASSLLGNFHVQWTTFALPALAVSILIGAAQFYSRCRPDPRVATALANTAQLIAFTALAAPLSYLAAALNLPLQDKFLDAADRALGFDWRALLHTMNAAPVIDMVLRPIYFSLIFQMIVAVLCLAFAGLLLRLRIYLLSFIFAALITVAISALLPAASPWPYYAPTTAESPHITPALLSSWTVLCGLRDGSFRTLIAHGSEGIISFPSFHAVCAVILIIAHWPIVVLRPVMLALNLAMLVATLIDGSHYFTDVLAGVALGAACFYAANAIATTHVAAERKEFEPTALTWWRCLGAYLILLRTGDHGSAAVIDVTRRSGPLQR